MSKLSATHATTERFAAQGLEEFRDFGGDFGLHTSRCRILSDPLIDLIATNMNSLNTVFLMDMTKMTGQILVKLGLFEGYCKHVGKQMAQSLSKV